VLSDVSGYDEMSYPYNFTVTATDGLGILKSIDYADSGARYTGVKNLNEHIINCLNKLPHVSTFWTGGDNFLRTAVDWWETSMTRAAANDPLDLTYVEHGAFYKFEKKGKVDFTSCYDVLKSILTAFGARIRMVNGYYFVEQIPIWTASSFNTRYWDNALAYQGTDTQTAAYTVDKTRLGAAITTLGKYAFMPPLSKVTTTFGAYSRRNYLAGVEVNEDLPSTNLSYTIVKFGDLATLRLTGKLSITIKNTGHTGTLLGPFHFMFKLFITLNTQSAKRTYTVNNFGVEYDAPTWDTAGTGTFVSIGVTFNTVPVLASGDAFTLTQDIDFTTIPIPNGSDNIGFQLAMDTIKKNDGTAISPAFFDIEFDLSEQWLEIYDYGNPALAEYETGTFVTNPDTTNSKPLEVETTIGDTSNNPNVVGRLRTTSDGGATFDDTVDWAEGATTPYTYLMSVLARLILEGQLKPLRRLQARIYGKGISLTKCLTWDSKTWLMQGATYETGNDLITGEWFELTYGTPVSVSPPVKIIRKVGALDPPNVVSAPTGASGNQLLQAFNLSNSPPPTVLGPIAFNALDTEILAAATVTSIDVATALIGNEFLVGDIITIVNPMSGQFQDFDVDVIPAAAATSISVTSEAADFDFPEGSYLMVKQKSYAFSLPDADSGDIMRFDGSIWDVYQGVTDGHVLTWDTTNGWQAEASTGSAPGDGDYGDITVSGSGAVWTIDDGVVSNSKIRDGVAKSVIGRASASGGDVADIQANTIGQVLVHGDVNLEFGQVVTASIEDGAITTAKITDDEVTYAKIQNVAADDVVLGNISGAGGIVSELTAANLYTLLSLLNGANTRIPFYTAANAMSASDRFEWDNTNGRLHVVGVNTSLGVTNAHLFIDLPAINSTTGIGVEGFINGTLSNIFSNTKNTATAHALLQIMSGGTSAGNPVLQFSISGEVTHAMGIDNSDGDKFKITPQNSNPGGVANKGLILTSEAAPKLGINEDNPDYELDVNGRARADTGFIGAFAQWAVGNITFGAGAGTSPTLNSHNGTDNALYISFTTGTTPTADGVIFTGTYPNAWSNTAIVTFSADEAQTATDITKFRTGGRSSTKFDLVANGTLSASTNYQLCFMIWGQ
jgi:hypothetical protein